MFLGQYGKLVRIAGAERRIELDHQLQAIRGDQLRSTADMAGDRRKIGLDAVFAPEGKGTDLFRAGFLRQLCAALQIFKFFPNLPINSGIISLSSRTH